MSITDELLPDIPNILIALDDILNEIDDIDDMSRVTKRQLLINQRFLTTALIDLAKYTVAKSYKIDILDKAVAHLNTEKEDPTPLEEKNDIEENDKGEFYI